MRENKTDSCTQIQRTHNAAYLNGLCPFKTFKATLNLDLKEDILFVN